MTYAEKLKDPRWQKKRLNVMERDKWKCVLCNDEKSTLHVHHDKYEGDPWDVGSDNLKTLCKHCHCTLEEFKKFPTLQKVRIHFIEKPTSFSNHTHLLIYCSLETFNTILLCSYTDETGITFLFDMRQDRLIELVENLKKINHNG